MVLGLWEVDVPSAKKPSPCTECAGPIGQGEMRFRWFPLQGGALGEKQFFHLNCAFQEGTERSSVTTQTLRKALGLTKVQRGTLDAALAGGAPITPAQPTGPTTPAAKGKPVEGASAKKGQEIVSAPLLGEPPAKKAKSSQGNVVAKASAAAKAVQANAPPLAANCNSNGSGANQNQKAPFNLRVGDIAAEPLERLGPIVGVMSSPRVPLMEAAVATGVEDMDACGYLAEENGALLAEGDEYKLDKDEAGALNLYTMDSELYPTLNGRLRDQDRPALKPFFPLLRLLVLARRKLPKFEGTVWRGVKADLRATYPKGKEVYWWAFSSTTKELSTLTNPLFLGKEGVRTIFNIQIFSGVDIMRYSAFQGEDSEAEVLLFPGTKLRVVDTMDMGNSLYQVHLQEVKVPVSLLK